MNSSSFIHTVLVLTVALFSVEMVAQDTTSDGVYAEQPQDLYTYVDRAAMPRSKARVGRNERFFYTQVNIDNNGLNIIGDAANEPSIAVNPTNPLILYIGWRQFDTISNNFRQAGHGYSTDGGISWAAASVIDPGVFRSDPVLAVSADGTFYYNSLSADFDCTQFSSDDVGTWDDGTFAFGGDKQWMTVDRFSGQEPNPIYLNWNPDFSKCGGALTRSLDDNLTYDSCYSLPGRPRWGTLTVDASGRLHIIGVGSYLRSSNAMNPSEHLTFDLNIASDLLIERPRAFVSNSPNPAGLLGQLWIDADRGGNGLDDNVYVLGSVSVEGNDPLDIMFAKSEDAGETWENPKRLNDDPGDNWQWFGTMSVAPNGRIDVVWLDTRANPGTFLSQLYYTYSEDGGNNWAENEILVEEAFDPHLGWPNQNKMGDYFHMVSDNDGADLAWAATFNGEQDVYYGRINSGIVSTKDYSSHLHFKVYPNPAKNKIYVSNSGHYKNLSYYVSDVYGNIVVDNSTITTSNSSNRMVEIAISHLPAGIYICTATDKKDVLWGYRIVKLK